jgi:hypothetical protein
MTKIADFLKAGVHVTILYVLFTMLTLVWLIFMLFSTT